MGGILSLQEAVDDTIQNNGFKFYILFKGYTQGKNP